MIDHIWSDGSIGHEYEIGDRVVIQREEFSLGQRPLGYIGREATVVGLDPYSRKSNYHTTFVRAKTDHGGYAHNLPSNYTPAPGQEPRLCIIESEVGDE